MKRKNHNNRGFTLVELIIAVAILALAVSPLVANFIQSSKMNLKGRKSLNAMNLAQDVMEGLSGYSADEIIKNVREVIDDTTGTKTCVGSILPVSATYSGVSETSAVTDAKKIYMFSDVETVSSAHNKYNVEVTLDPTGTDHEYFNEQEVADISEINQFYDATFTVPEAEVNTAIHDLWAKSPYPSVMEDSYKGNIRRTTTVEITNSGTEDDPVYAVKVTREYNVVTEFIGTCGVPSSEIITYTTSNISRMDEDKFPRSVYIYFVGMENATYVQSEKRENIVINNSTGKEIDVYLIRTQKTDTSGAVLAEDVAYGTNFGCNVKIFSTDMTGAETEDVHIISNLRYDLNAPAPRYNFRVKDEDGNNISEEEINYPYDDSGVQVPKSASTYDKRRADYYYNNSLLDEALYATNFTAGYQKKDKNTIYKVTINLYEPTTGEKVATYDGGVSN